MMKTQVLLLLSLICFSALARLDSDLHATFIGSVDYLIGYDDRDCAISRVEGSHEVSWKYTNEATSRWDCIPRGIVAVGQEIWVVFEITQFSKILSSSNFASGYSETEIMPEESVGRSNVVIGRIDTSNVQGTFGKFTYGSYLGSYEPDYEYWTTFEVKRVAKCDKIIQIEGDTESSYSFLVNEKGESLGISGYGVFFTFDVSTLTLGGLSADEKICDGEEEEGEWAIEQEEQEEGEEGEWAGNEGSGSEGEMSEEIEVVGNNTNILSIISVLLAFLSIVAV